MISRKELLLEEKMKEIDEKTEAILQKESELNTFFQDLETRADLILADEVILSYKLIKIRKLLRRIKLNYRNSGQN